MGRLRKAKVDEIVRLRSEGYTQKETAEKAKVNLKTVRKYDPLKESKQCITPLEEKVRCLEHLVHYLVGMTTGRDEAPPLCPHCENQDLLWAEGQQSEARRTVPDIHTWACPKCGFFIDTYQRIDPESIRWVSRKTGMLLKSPPGRGRAAQTGTRRKRS